MKRVAMIMVFFVATVVSSIAQAEQIKIEVKGMVCSFCAQGIKKTFMRKDGVEGVDVDLEKKTVIITTKKDVSLNDSDLTESIADAGYEVIKIERSV